jgi:hypothetical protein
MVFLTSWPALLFLPALAFLTAMTVSAVVSATGSGGVSQAFGVVIGTLAGALAVLGFCLSLALVAPALFDHALALERMAAFSPFGFLGGVAGTAWERGHRLSALWR